MSVLDRSKLHVYFVSAIDFWPGMMDLDDAVRVTIAREAHQSPPRNPVEREFDPDLGRHVVVHLQKLTEIAMREAKRIGWQGDIRDRCGPFYFSIPAELTCRFGVAWKQDNNGDTVVASPFPMPWLDDIAHSRPAIVDVELPEVLGS